MYLQRRNIILGGGTKQSVRSAGYTNRPSSLLAHVLQEAKINDTRNTPVYNSWFWS